MTTFTDLGVPDAIAKALVREGFDAPFAIQTTALPDALAGRDVSGCAPTGSGKTLAFSIPVAAMVGEARPGRPRALLLTPTRELAGQIREALLPLAAVRNRTVATFYGGTNIKADLKQLRRGVDIAVCTPGRLADLVQRGDCDLSDVDMVVLDEADRMADMGFLPEVKRLLDRTSPKRQTLLFSATLDGDVDVLVKRYQHDPVRHEVEAEAADTGDVRHLFWPVTREGRRPLATEALRDRGPAIVFCRTKRGADRLAKQLRQAGINTAAIHGDRSQNQRERALAQFSDGQVTTLVATDVAARGIHVDDVAMVLHYDLPPSDKDYVHRSGRTGRAGADGVVVSLVFDDQHDDLHKIQRSLDLPKGLDRGDVGELERGGALVGVGATTNGGSGGRGNEQQSNQRSGGQGSGSRSSGSKSGSRSSSKSSRNGSSNGNRNRTRSGGGSTSGSPSGGARSRTRRKGRR